MALLEMKVKGGLQEEMAFEFSSEGEGVSQPCKRS